MSDKKQRKIMVPTDMGELLVPATNHIEQIPHLAVTMCVFGQFEVTHVSSGLRLVGGFERAVNALVFMSQLQLAINELGIDASGNADSFKSEITTKDKHCECLGMKLMEWMHLNTMLGKFCSEFPWETDEEGPVAELMKLNKKLGVECNE